MMRRATLHTQYTQARIHHNVRYAMTQFNEFKIAFKIKCNKGYMFITYRFMLLALITNKIVIDSISICSLRLTPINNHIPITFHTKT